MRKLTVWEWMLVGLIAINLVYVTTGAVVYPLAHVDVWSNWLYKAKAIYLSNWSFTFLPQWSGEFAHPQYPLLLPVLFAGIYVVYGGVNEVVVSLLSPLMYGLSIWLGYVLLRRLQFQRLAALVLMYVYSMLSPLLAQGGRFHAGMPDLYITVLYWIGLHLLWLLHRAVAKPSKRKAMWALILVSVLASWIKLEGCLLSLLILCTPYPTKQKLSYWLVALTGLLSWQAVRLYWLIPSSYGLALPDLLELIGRLRIVIQSVVVEVFANWRNWYWFWWLFGFLYVGVKPARTWVKKTIQPLWWLLVVSLAGIYLFSTVPTTGYVSSSLDRLLLQISPIWLVLFADRLLVLMDVFVSTVQLLLGKSGLRKYVRRQHRRHRHR